MRVATLFMIMMLSFEGLALMGVTQARAQPGPMSLEDGAAAIRTAESLPGTSEKILKEDPVCDPSHRPQITKIEPDEFQPGAKVVIMGEDFGQEKQCLFEVTFGYEKAKDFMLVGNERIEATAPDSLSTGMIFVSVITGGGGARSAVLVKKQE
ncbi:MAG: hypothetical protein OEY91_12955 [Nitrospirota bacterium]|nr:hypothetical protein [Nitrospirota bacterium]